MTRVTITRHGDDTYDSWVVTGIPGVEQVEVYATYHDDPAAQNVAIDEARKVAERIGMALTDGPTASTPPVIIVTVPSDDHTEPHVFTDWDHATIVTDAVEGAIAQESSLLDADFARYLVEQETGE